jgi:hypothetical protein
VPTTGVLVEMDVSHSWQAEAKEGKKGRPARVEPSGDY